MRVPVIEILHSCSEVGERSGDLPPTSKIQFSLPPDYWSVAQRCQNRVAIEGRKRFVDDFIDDILVNGKLLTWEGGVLGWEPCNLPLHPPFRFLCGQD